MTKTYFRVVGRHLCANNSSLGEAVVFDHNKFESIKFEF